LKGCKGETARALAQACASQGGGRAGQGRARTARKLRGSYIRAADTVGRRSGSRHKWPKAEMIREEAVACLRCSPEGIIAFIYRRMPWSREGGRFSPGLVEDPRVRFQAAVRRGIWKAYLAVQANGEQERAGGYAIQGLALDVRGFKLVRAPYTNGSALPAVTNHLAARGRSAIPLAFRMDEEV